MGEGGHRNAAVALQTVISQQQRDWQIELIQISGPNRIAWMYCAN